MRAEKAMKDYGSELNAITGTCARAAECSCGKSYERH